MLNYLLRRLILLPLTIFCIIVINFVIINLAPGEPSTQTERSEQGGATRSEEKATSFKDDQYLQFREHYGLTLPILFNTWPWLSENDVLITLKQLIHRDQISTEKFNHLRIKMGDQARFVMPELLRIMAQTDMEQAVKELAFLFFLRGATKQAFLGGSLSTAQKEYNRVIARNHIFLRTLSYHQVNDLQLWYQKNAAFYHFELSRSEKVFDFFFETRFARYLGKVCTLDFGTMRNDHNKTVLSEVTKRFKYSLTLAVIPMLVTFVFCQLFAFLMALKQNRWQDISLNICFLILYATPVFVVAPFLIEKVALNHTFPFTDIPIPISGFTSSETIYEAQTSWQRLIDIAQHIALPIIAIVYGSLAAQSRLSRTAILEVIRQDYVRTAKAKGLGTFTILWRHVGRNASITIVTSIASSLGIILGGSLIVETIFEINGFGRFFYEAIINRDYNVIMFSALAGSFFTLVGYLMADIAYTVLDPRVTLD